MAAENQVIEDMGLGVIVTWFRNRHVVMFSNDPYHPAAHSREQTDMWADTVLQTLHDWPQDRVYRAIQDATHAAYSPYSLKRLNEITRARPKEIRGRNATIVPKSALQGIFIQITNRMGRLLGRKMETRAFTSFEEAFAWVCEGLEEEQPQSAIKDTSSVG